MGNAEKLRELAAWYRDFAERAGNPWIGEARLQLAEDLEKQAAMLERQPSKKGRFPVHAEQEVE